METAADKLWDLLARWEELYRQGRDVSAEDLCRDCPELTPEVAARINSLKRMDWLLKPAQEDQRQGSTNQPIQTFFLGEYTVLERIGAGGMGQVFKALHRRMDRIVALKVLPKEIGKSFDALERFQQEVRSAARLSHPNIVTAYDAGELDGSPFLVMEYVDGHDFFRHVQQHGPLPVAQAVGCVQQAARGLDYAHVKGIVHGDVKPANLLLSSADASVKVSDLGLARFRFASAGNDAVVGTADYLAPEQTLEPRQVDHRSDIYSLGCTLFYLLTGKPMYEGQTVIQKMLGHREQPTPSLRRVRPEVSEALDGVFQRMVAKKPADRFQSMAEVVQALERLQQQNHPSKNKRKKRLWIAAAAVLVTFLFLGYPSLSRFWSGDRHSTAEQEQTTRPIEASRDSKTSSPSAGAVAQRFSEVEIEKPFDGYLLAHPLLMEVAGAKVIRLENGNQMVIAVASTVLKHKSPNERLRGERVCRAKALASVVAEREGVQVAHAEQLKERTVIVLDGEKEKGKSVSELLQVTKTTVQGITKDMPVVGRWMSKEGDVFYLAIGVTVDKKGNTVRLEFSK
jgi:serine/threonine protein kinase